MRKHANAGIILEIGLARKFRSILPEIAEPDVKIIVITCDERLRAVDGLLPANVKPAGISRITLPIGKLRRRFHRCRQFLYANERRTLLFDLLSEARGVEIARPPGSGFATVFKLQVINPDRPVVCTGISDRKHHWAEKPGRGHIGGHQFIPCPLTS
ncbi:MAG: hypothetical protein IJ982_09650 [Fibrobacter sp.]|nr:hypothetical protein [Fibrobacter sp.]